MEKLQDFTDLERVLTDIANELLAPNMYTRCLDCQTWGCCFPYDRRCGNCNSLNTARYYAESVICAYTRRERGESICDASLNPRRDTIGRNDKTLSGEVSTAFLRQQDRPINCLSKDISSLSDSYGNKNGRVGVSQSLEPIDDNPMPELKPGYIASVKVSTDTIEGVVYKVYGKEFNFVCRKFGNDYQQYHIDMVTKIIYQHRLIWERKP